MRACACKCMRVYVHVTKGGLKACVCVHVSVCICVCNCLRVYLCVTHTHILFNLQYSVGYNNGRLSWVVWVYKPSYRHTCINTSVGTHIECNTYYNN